MVRFGLNLNYILKEMTLKQTIITFEYLKKQKQDELKELSYIFYLAKIGSETEKGFEIFKEFILGSEGDIEVI